ncbi:uncharacterized protein LOC129923447 [Biomphalaria glabrata]|uniref:Uncharacterized protein LOC129923447 n=1 Tax=Biomphalaria glabrata TaxID=6526 RepID=A0A9W2Z5Y1_BIOGL|nr:uncharacterized protein LOC129923447 [Biomphalaria glabrata]
MNILVVTILYGLSLGSSFGKSNSPLSQQVLQILRENVPEVNGTVFSEDDGDSSNLNDQVDQSNYIFPDMIQELMTEALVATNYNLKDLTFTQNNCWCRDFTCGCCYQVNLKKIHLKATACLTIAYLPNELGAQVTLTINGKIVVNKKVSARNPPPICEGIPFLHKLAGLCLRFSNLDFSNKHFTGCAELEVKWIKVVVAKVNLGCFKIPPKE